MMVLTCRRVRGWVCLAMLCCLGCDASVPLAPQGEAEEEKIPVAANAAEVSRALDQEAAKILAGKSEEGEQAVDTEEFFSKPEKYAIWKGDPAVFKKLFEEIRAAGAPATHAVCSEAFGVKNVAASYIITLPQEADPRKKVIDLYNSFWNDVVERDLEDIDPSAKEEYRRELMEEVESEFATDSGQKYIILMFDP